MCSNPRVLYILILLYFAFVHSQILYGIEVYANTCHAQLNKLCVLNNKVLSIIQNKPLCTLVVQLYKSYNTLPIPKLHHFQLLCLVFKYFNCKEKKRQLYLQTTSPLIVKFTHIILDLLMISIYPESIIYVESDALNLKQASCGTICRQN